MVLITLAQTSDDATRALRLGNAWGVLLLVALVAFVVIILAARALRPGRHAPTPRQEEELGGVSIDPWEEAGRRLRADDEDDGTVRHEGVRNP